MRKSELMLILNGKKRVRLELPIPAGIDVIVVDTKEILNMMKGDEVVFTHYNGVRYEMYDVRGWRDVNNDVVLLSMFVV